MRHSRSVKIMIIVALVVVLTGLTTAYAMLTQKLIIKGSAAVEGADWDVKFESATSDCETTCTGADCIGKAVCAKPSIENNTTLNINTISLYGKNAKASVTFKVKNNGTIGAVIGVISDMIPICEGLSSVTGKPGVLDGKTDPNDADGKRLCDNLDITLNYSGDSGSGKVNEGDVIAAQQSKEMTLTFAIKSSATDADLPSDDVRVTNLNLSMIFNQLNDN